MSTPGEHDFEVLTSETVYSGAILALRLDRIAMPGGRTAERETVEHYGAVAIVAVDDDDRVVLVHQYRAPIGRRLWELPAGLLDEAGEDPLEAARRELREETGLEARDWSVLVDVASSPGFTDEAVRVFLARDLVDVGRPPAQDEEADLTLRRVAARETVEMSLAGEIVNATAVAGLMAYAAARDLDPGRLRSPNAPWRDRPTRFARRREAERDPDGD
ncbi:NUDIX hydrolase [Rhodococcus rhodnii]|uniref:ADP-ribose diphosphatase n=2 Tax=Rhodococcus rhodnii TaxID=38312 RepID=R7WWF0_9NOCA|nr:NUDIX hydrolase [Rhodococcus rhodnii]EOM78469.1 ADP-ribose diphosphatase [Rhodococcus rhodnii LMG 5362]TXG91271.1 NUDIX hydrolase [Rhodococcus rhodnii]